VTASHDYTTAIWDVATGKRELSDLTGDFGYARIVNWSPDSKWIVTGAWDNTICVFDVETGSLVCKPLTGHTRTPTMLAFRSSLLHHDIEAVSG
jgi:WD40 repeat protein